MQEKLGIEESKIPDLCTVLYQKYGTTMAGLRVLQKVVYVLLSWCKLVLMQTLLLSSQAIGYNFNYDDYHRFEFDSILV